MEECHEGDIWTIAAHWKCGPCFTVKGTDTIFNDSNEFENHLGRFCHICNEEYASFESWQRHHTNSHIKDATRGKVSGAEVFYCHHCGQVYSTAMMFAQHMNKHKIYKCLGCTVGFSDFEKFSSHAETCSPSWKNMVYVSPIHDCRTCSLLSKSTKELLVHFLRCNLQIRKEADELGLAESEIKDSVMRGLKQYEVQCKTKKKSKLMILVPQSKVLSEETNQNQIGHDGYKIVSMENGQIKMVGVGNNNEIKGKKSSQRTLITPAIKKRKADTMDSLQISSVQSILTDVFDSPTEEVIEKIVELTSNRSDLLERIVLGNLSAIKNILMNPNSSNNQPNEDMHSAENFDFHVENDKSEYEVRECSVKVDQMNLKPNLTYSITSVSLPDDFLPFGLSDFSILDSQ